MKKRTIMLAIVGVGALVGAKILATGGISYSYRIHATADQARRAGTLVGIVDFGRAGQRHCGVGKGWVERIHAHWKARLFGYTVVSIDRPYYLLGVGWKHGDPVAAINRFMNECQVVRPVTGSTCSGVYPAYCMVDLGTGRPQTIELRDADGSQDVVTAAVVPASDG